MPASAFQEFELVIANVDHVAAAHGLRRRSIAR